MSAESIVVFLAAFAGGVVNSVAGGGTLISFPALVWIGRDPIVANVTNTVGLVPASFGAMLGYRRELAKSSRWVSLLAVPSLAGGILGAYLLLRTPSRTFSAIVPYLILFATLLFAVGDRIAARIHPPAGASAERWTPGSMAAAVGFQFLIAVYGGYFGAGIGILMLAALALIGLADIHEMNAVKSALAILINGVAACYFATSGRVMWSDALLMAVAATVGGYGGAGMARRLGQPFVRRAVVAIGLAMTVSLAWRH